MERHEVMDRRGFLAQTGKGLAGAALAGTVLQTARPRRVLGANERLNVSLIGCGGRGNMVARSMIQEKLADVAWVCDLHPKRREAAAEFMRQGMGRRPALACDMRQVLDDKAVDAVIVATPDHWHTLATIRACEAGKDVYVEKPHSHNLWESRQMIAAASKYGRVVQVGAQNRSAPYNLQARERIAEGKLGKIHLVKVYNLKPGGPFHLGEASAAPANFDWNEWHGPAAVKPYHERLFRAGWHHYWNYSGGDLSDDGVHQLDLAMMVMGQTKMPNAVSASGGRLAHQGDDSEVPDVLVATYDFDDYVMTFEHSNYPSYMEKTTTTIRRNDELPYWTQNATRIELYGSDYMMILGRHGGGWVIMTKRGRLEEKMYGRVPDVPHQRNFVECVKSRKQANANPATLEVGTGLVHLANIAHRMGNRKLRYDAAAMRFTDCEKANQLVRRQYRKGYEVGSIEG